MITRSTDWDDLITNIVEHLGANPKQVIPGSAVLEQSGSNSYVTFTCSFLLTPSELSKIHKETVTND